MAIHRLYCHRKSGCRKNDFLNKIFEKRKVKALVIQFEDGEEDLFCGCAGHRKLMIPRRMLDQQQEADTRSDLRGGTKRGVGRDLG